MNTNSTITITVNIAANRKYEGNAEIRINLPEEEIQRLTNGTFSQTLNKLVEQAVKEYNERNNQ